MLGSANRKSTGKQTWEAAPQTRETHPVWTTTAASMGEKAKATSWQTGKPWQIKDETKEHCLIYLGSTFMKWRQWYVQLRETTPLCVISPLSYPTTRVILRINPPLLFRASRKFPDFLRHLSNSSLKTSPMMISLVFTADVRKEQNKCGPKPNPRKIPKTSQFPKFFSMKIGETHREPIENPMSCGRP